MKEEHTPEARLKRKMERRREIGPKSLSDLARPLYEAQFQATKNPSIVHKVVTMQAKCSRLAGRMITVGSTVFKFDGDGICRYVPKFRASEVRDFEVLLKMSGVTDITEDTSSIDLVKGATKNVAVSEVAAVKATALPAAVNYSASTAPAAQISVPTEVSAVAKPVAIPATEPVTKSTATPVIPVTPTEPVVTEIPPNDVESEGEDDSVQGGNDPKTGRGRRSRKQP